MAEDRDEVDEAQNDNDSENEALSSRADNLARTKKVKDKLRQLYTQVEEGFNAQQNRAVELEDYWDIYNCTLGTKQFYQGNSEIFVPIVYEALEARKTRFVNQLFPPSHRNVEVISEDATLPQAMTALAEHYVRRSGLRLLAPALVLNGDVEGQYSLYVRWSQHTRHIVHRVKKPVEIEEGMPTDEDVDDIEEMDIKSDHPVVELISDADLLVLPAVADNLTDALERGGSVTILRRWGKAKLQSLIDDDEIDKKMGEQLIQSLDRPDSANRKDHEKRMVDAAGIKSDARGKFCLVYETWSMVTTPEGVRLCRTYFAGPNKVLSCKRNPLWCDRLPIISCPTQKIKGSFKGRSLLESVATLQYYANDTLNQAADSSAYSMLPIIMSDPERNPRMNSMVMSLAAVWAVDPNSTKFAQFPPLWKDGLQIIAQTKQEIFQALSVNPARITQGSNKKMSQAEVANEQQVDVLTTADAVTTLENGVFTPLLTLFMEMDHQYRDKHLTIRSFGEMGRRMQMQEVPPLQMNKRYEFLWFGVEAARSTQQVQQQIGALNMLRGIPPQLYPGYKLNMAPAIVRMVENAFGPRLGPVIFEDLRTQLEDDIKLEIEMALDGIESPVHEFGDHQVATQMLMLAAQKTGDPTGVIRTQIMKHRQFQMQQMMAQQQQGQGQPGAPGGSGPGVAGTPRPGAIPAQQRPAQQPPGAIHADQMHTAMPRRIGA